MAIFEGKNFSTIYDKMPDRLWDKSKFFSDWESQIREKNKLWKDDEIEIAKKTIINGFYATYQELFNILNNENLSENVRNTLKRKLNLAMTNILEYGQRRTKDIILSLRDRKLSSAETGADIFNGLIDNLIFEIQKADKEFYEVLEKRKI